MIIQSREQIDNKYILACCSIGGSPIHAGHTKHILDCKPSVLKYLNGVPPGQYNIDNIKLLVIVNCDSFLYRKHSFVFQSENERAEIFDSLKSVDYTYIYQSDGQTVADALSYFQPDFFCKGGDRGIGTLPEDEIKAAKDNSVVILYGVGGSDKVTSSSDLIKRAANHYFYEKPVSDWLEERNKYQFKDLMEYPADTISTKIDDYRNKIDRFYDSKFY